MTPVKRRDVMAALLGAGGFIVLLLTAGELERRSWERRMLHDRLDRLDRRLERERQP